MIRLLRDGYWEMFRFALTNGTRLEYYSPSRQWAAYHLRDLIILYGAAIPPDNLDIFTPVNLIVSPFLAVTNASYFRN